MRRRRISPTIGFSVERSKTLTCSRCSHLEVRISLLQVPRMAARRRPRRTAPCATARFSPLFLLPFFYVFSFFLFLFFSLFRYLRRVPLHLLLVCKELHRIHFQAAPRSLEHSGGGPLSLGQICRGRWPRRTRHQQVVSPT